MILRLALLCMSVIDQEYQFKQGVNDDSITMEFKYENPGKLYGLVCASFCPTFCIDTISRARAEIVIT